MTAGEPGTEEFKAVKKLLDDLDKASRTFPDDVYTRAKNKMPVENEELA